MRKEAGSWWLQAQKDLQSAEKNLEIEEYYLVAFLCQQAVEKGLKALYIHRLKESPGATHSLLFLGKKVEIPDEFLTFLRKMTPDFVLARYPDAADGLPYELYDRDIAGERLGSAKKVLEWIRGQLP
jgi:HEPN domain-containing protein